MRLLGLHRGLRSASRITDASARSTGQGFLDHLHSYSGGTYRVADLELTRVGFGAMQLAGPGVFGPPQDRDAAIAVLRAAVDLGIRHIDTADFYGPRVTNELIREALAPYPDDLHIVTKVGARTSRECGRRPIDHTASPRRRRRSCS